MIVRSDSSENILNSYRIFVDFDSTFIHETLLIQWVKFMILRSELSPETKFRFAVNASYKGIFSVAASHSEITSPFAVKLAFRTFKDISKRTVDAFIHYQQNGTYLINLNIDLIENLTKIVTYIRNSLKTEAKMIIYSQGSFKYAISAFLQREDVCECLKKASIPLDAISICANDIIMANDILTGELKPDIVTKYNRIEALSLISEPYLFIGDEKDEMIIKKQTKPLHFLNHRRLPFMSIEEILSFS